MTKRIKTEAELRRSANKWMRSKKFMRPFRRGLKVEERLRLAGVPPQ